MKKKWLFLIVILIIVAVVLTIVFVNLFRDKNTKALATELNSVTQRGFLNEKDERNMDIDAYLNSLTALSELADAREQIENYVNEFAAFEIAGDFFNRQMVFTVYTDIYKNNLKQIKDCFKKAQVAADKLEMYFVENDVKIDGTTEWLARTWFDCKANVEDLFNYTTQAFDCLTNVYKASVPSKIMNNALSDVILDEFNKMTNAVGQAQAGFGAKLLKFANDYLSVENEKTILRYAYSLDLQNKAKDLKEKGENSTFYPDFLAGKIA